MKQRWVVKAGSNMVCSGGPLLLRAWMEQVAKLRRDFGIEVIWVTSGAIATAVDRTHFVKRERKLAEKQALSAIGQPLVMDIYNLSLQRVGLMGAQVLLTADDLAAPKRRQNLINTLKTLLKWKAVPILNENDAISTEEIKFGDNDRLSAKVATVMKADRLVILTDVSGLHSEDPRKNPKSKLVHHLREVTSKILASVETASGTERGTGGMYSKLMAAREANQAGIEAWLVRGDDPSILIAVAQNQNVGTRVARK
jgi:glutamate 5-kinase